MTSDVRGKETRWLLVASLLAVALLFVPFFLDMRVIWETHPYAGHGMFVPLFSLVILWGDRFRLRSARGQGVGTGVVLVLVGVALLGLGTRWGNHWLQVGALIVACAGFVLWTYGPAGLKTAAFPLGLLAFMMPIPWPVVGACSLNLRLFATAFTGVVLDLLGVPSYREGVFLHLPSTTLEVAQACDGLRFLIALFILALTFAHVTQRTVGRRLVLALSAVPLAILANAIRVGAIAAAAHYVGPEAATGLTHHSIGKGIWLLTLVPLALIATFLRRGGRTAAPTRSASEGVHRETLRSEAPAEKGVVPT